MTERVLLVCKHAKFKIGQKVTFETPRRHQGVVFAKWKNVEGHWAYNVDCGYAVYRIQSEDRLELVVD